jgi:hypothetical protein
VDPNITPRTPTNPTKFVPVIVTEAGAAPPEALTGFVFVITGGVLLHVPSEYSVWLRSFVIAFSRKLNAELGLVSQLRTDLMLEP